MMAFVDTFALLAWLNPRDDAHVSVTTYLDGFVGSLLTTEWVLMELADALCNPPARSTVVAFLRKLRADPTFEVVGYIPSVYRAGFDLYSDRHDKAWSLTDCISFAVMADRKLTDALTADHHFEQAGFRAVFKQ
jgi:predicted nucleic acid-binding protein